jgi:malic enzyme
MAGAHLVAETAEQTRKQPPGTSEFRASVTHLLYEAIRRGQPAPVPFRGIELLGRSLLNKGTAFTDEERDAFGLRGLLPSEVRSIELQVRAELEHIRDKEGALERYIGLAATHDRNETLFYRVLVENIEQFLPIVYTPTVGQACQRYSHILRTPRGLWITPEDVGRMPDLLRAAARDDVRLIVATDNERILGLGDQGAGGMGIPIGKLALYTAGAGIYPSWTLPISLDVGTDNRELLDDSLYVGYPHPRLRGPAYDAFVESFVAAVGATFPRALVQWEDFKQHTAVRVLQRYRERLPSFNDDIQGTAAVVLGGVLAALRLTGQDLLDQRFVLVGAGAAGIGIARLIRLALERRGAGPEQIEAAITGIDSRGLVYEGRDRVDPDKRAFAKSASAMRELRLPRVGMHDLETVVAAARPTVLIGTSGSPGAFTEDAIRDMASAVERPIVLPLSNPTASSEATPEDVLEWSEGRAIVATGSPFEPVERRGVRHVIGQANNVFVFPGIGLGLIVAEVRTVPDEIFLVAAETLAEQVDAERLATGAIYPPPHALREVSRAIAERVVREARDLGVGRAIRDDAVRGVVAETMWYPDYAPYRAV